MLALFVYYIYSIHVTAMKEVVSTIHTLSNKPKHHRKHFHFSWCLHVILTSSEASQTRKELLSKWLVIMKYWQMIVSCYIVAMKNGKVTN